MGRYGLDTSTDGYEVCVSGYRWPLLTRLPPLFVTRLLVLISRMTTLSNKLLGCFQSSYQSGSTLETLFFPGVFNQQRSSFQILD